MRKKTCKLAVILFIILGAIIFNGCGVPKPGLRMGSYATATVGTNFLDSNSLGRHSFKNHWSEGNGIVYTCRGGHIDIAHARIAADNVRYLQDKSKRNISSKNREFAFKLKVEPSTYYVKLEYPLRWGKLSGEVRQKIIDEVSIEMGEYLTYIMTTWHEVLTWFGYKSMGIIPEQPSAFSWEDMYSNVFGIQLGAEALRDKSHNYDTAMTIALKRELEDLGIQSAETARKASEKVRGTWWTGAVFVDMKVRNTDVGIDDGFVSPMLVPGICEGAEPKPCPIPTLDKFHKYGFAMFIEVAPKEFERGQFLKVIYPNGAAPDKIQPAKVLPIVIDYINKEVEKKQKRERLGN
jgi:hypothetical protein